jgi:CheY-like chemotaxis protein
MAKGFAEQSGGSLGIGSIVGRGTVVSIWLPAAENAAVTQPEPQEAGTASPPCLAACVLLVDDDAMVREPVAAELQEAGYRVLAAGGGEEALTLLDAGEAVDVLVCDHAMPGMNGLTVIREAQARRPGLPALLLTGYAGDGAALAASAPDASFTLLRKPIPIETLAARLAILLNARAAS